MIAALSEATTARVIQAWRVMSGLPDAFRTPGSTITGIVDDALICPPGWCGYVRIGDRTVMTAPGPEQAARLSEAAFRIGTGWDRRSWPTLITRSPPFVRRRRSPGSPRATR
jgi:hypothetical protein